MRPTNYAIEGATGERPYGWYTGRFSYDTRRLVVEEGGFLYSADSYADDLPYWVRVDGTVFAQPVSVGDPGAKGVRDDDKVVVDGEQLHAGCVESPQVAKRRRSGRRSEVDALNQLAQGLGRATVV